MTQPRPTAEELIEAVRSFLSDEVLPTLEGRLRFHTRVAANVLETVERELRGGPAADEDERIRLLGLLGEPTDHAGPPGAADVAGLSRELASRIRSGAVDVDDPEVVDHLRRTARADVAIANPRWLPAPTDRTPPDRTQDPPGGA